MLSLTEFELKKINKFLMKIEEDGISRSSEYDQLKKIIVGHKEHFQSVTDYLLSQEFHDDLVKKILTWERIVFFNAYSEDKPEHRGGVYKDKNPTAIASKIIETLAMADRCFLFWGGFRIPVSEWRKEAIAAYKHIQNFYKSDLKTRAEAQQETEHLVGVVFQDKWKEFEEHPHWGPIIKDRQQMGK